MIVSSMVAFGRAGWTGYFARGTPGRVGVIVLQEWWGLNEHMREMARRFAREGGFLALAPDLYGGRVATDAQEASHLMEGLDWEQAMGQVREAAVWLREQGASQVAVLGFCMGGALTVAAACNAVDGAVDAGVCFYGVPPPSVADLGRISMPMQCHFGDRDQSEGFSDPATANKLEEALGASGMPFEFYRYDADHAFMNETRPEVFSAEASKLAFSRACQFIGRLNREP